MIAKFNDTCRGCGDAIAAGDLITWTADGGPRCADCGPAAPDERRGAATASEDAPGYVRALERRVAALETTVSAMGGDVAELYAWAATLARDLGVPPPRSP